MNEPAPTMASMVCFSQRKGTFSKSNVLQNINWLDLHIFVIAALPGFLCVLADANNNGALVSGR